MEQAAQSIIYSPKKRLGIFRNLDLAERSFVFNQLSPAVRQEIMKRLSLDEVVELLDHLDLRRAHHVLDRMENRARRSRIIARLKNDRHAKIEYFCQFHPEASVGLVHLNYVFLADNTTVGDTAGIIEDYLRHTGKIPAVLVSQNGRLAGEVSLGTLVREPNRNKLAQHLQPIATILYNAPREKILNLFTAKAHRKVAILDYDGSVLGLVYNDDVLDLLSRSPAASLYSFAGVEESERPFDSAWSKVSHRYRWLIMNLVTAFLAGSVIALFENTLTQVAFLAMYLPIVSGMGGNAATQTLAVMVRGIAIGEISLRNSRPAIIREVRAGLINGLITGLLVAIIAVILNQTPLFGLVVGLSIMANLVLAGLAGTIVPLLMRYFGKDPATSATVFITTATDVLGFLILLGLATLILI
ncbi:hypothetical protein BK006_02250 [bacterium CG10_49_38]|nr:MAG: hypothetical protein BK006_02250 [bacterium CG10_49_38]